MVLREGRSFPVYEEENHLNLERPSTSVCAAAWHALIKLQPVKNGRGVLPTVSRVYLVLLNKSSLETLLQMLGPDSRFVLDGTMKKQTEQELRGEIDRLLRQQVRFLESRSFGTATEAELHEYEVRQDLMRELWEKLVLSNHRMTFIQTGNWSHST
jgi:hypothetical protein